MNITDAFTAYGAKRKDQYNSYSPIASDGSVVVSLWQHLFRKRPGSTGGQRYEDL
jgi:hypothetical protein